jgi:hypothetical protein
MADYEDKKWAKAVLKNAGTTKTKITSVDDAKGFKIASVPKNPTKTDVAEAEGILGIKSIKESIEDIGRKIDRTMTRKKRAMEEWRGSGGKKKSFDAKGLWDAITKNKGGSIKKGDSNYYAHGGSVRKTKLSDY